MSASSASRISAVAITVLLLFGGVAVAVSGTHSATPASSHVTASASPSYAYATGGPSPTSGPTTCPGSTPYTTAQIVILPDGSVSPSGAPVTKTGNVYQLQDPVQASLLVRASNVTIDGSGCTITYTTVGGFGNLTGVEVRNATDVTLEYFSITGTFNNGLYVNGSSAVTAYNSSAESAVDYGLIAYESQNVNFTKNNVSGSECGIIFEDVVDGLALENQAVGTTDLALYSYVTTDVAYIDNYGPGAADFAADFYYDEGTVLMGNNLSSPGAGEYGLYFEGSGDDLIQGNNLSGSEYYGAYIDVSYGAISIIGNDFSGGVQYGVYAYETWYGGLLSIVDNDFENTTEYGLYLYYTGPVNVTGNNFSLNLTGESTYGVYTYYVYGSTTISDNNFTGGFEYGVYLYSDGPSMTVSDNNLANTTYIGVYEYYGYSVTISDNDLSSNTTHAGYGIYVYYGYPGSGASLISGNNITGGWEYGVSFEYVYGPFDVVLNDIVGYTDSGVFIYEGYAPVQVLDNDLAANATTALDDVTGVYSEDSLTGPMSVSGNNLSNVGYGFYGDSSITGNLTFDDNQLLNVSEGGLYYDDDVYGAFSASGNNFTAAPGDAPYGLYVDYVYGSESFTNNTIVGADYGILGYGSTGDATVSGNVITDPWDDGLYLEDSYSGLSVTQNTVSGNRSSISATADGIYVDDPGGGSLASVSDNTISGGLGDGIDFEDPFSPVNLVEDNSVSQTIDVAVFIYESQSPTVVAGNTITDAQSYGIEFYDPGNLTIEGNGLQHTNVSIYGSDVYAPLLIEGNNATDSNVSLEIVSSSLSSVTLVEGNDFSHSKAVDVNNSLSGFVGNNFLGTPDLTLAGDAITAFYHNNVETSGGSVLNLTGSHPLSGVFNAALPVGGNFWTGYTPTSCTNGICTPEYLVPSLSGSSGYYDLYPLGEAWTNYAITFAETGLPTGATWSVTVGSTVLSAVAPLSVLFYPQNAQSESYPYQIPGVGAYTVVTPASGSFMADGTAQTISVTFSAPTYAVNFTESGLAAGVSWYVNSTGSPSFTSGAFSVTAAGSQTFHLGNLTNGTYSFLVAVGHTGYRASPALGGSFTVNGAKLNVSYTFTAVTYSVTFSVSGLPSGSSWTVTVAGAPQSSTTSTIVVALANGTYTYTVTGPGGYTMTPSSSSLTVSGIGTTVYLAATSSSSSSSGVSNTLFYGLLGALIVVAILALLGWVLLMRKRSGGSSGGSPPGGPKPWQEGETSPSPPPGASAPEGPSGPAPPPPP